MGFSSWKDVAMNLFLKEISRILHHCLVWRVPGNESISPPSRHFWVDDFPFNVCWDILVRSHRRFLSTQLEFGETGRVPLRFKDVVNLGGLTSLWKKRSTPSLLPRWNIFRRQKRVIFFGGGWETWGPIGRIRIRNHHQVVVFSKDYHSCMVIGVVAPLWFSGTKMV